MGRFESLNIESGVDRRGVVLQDSQARRGVLSREVMDARVARGDEAARGQIELWKEAVAPGLDAAADRAEAALDRMERLPNEWKKRVETLISLARNHNPAAICWFVDNWRLDPRPDISNLGQLGRLIPAMDLGAPGTAQEAMTLDGVLQMMRDACGEVPRGVNVIDPRGQNDRSRVGAKTKQQLQVGGFLVGLGGLASTGIVALMSKERSGARLLTPAVYVGLSALCYGLNAAGRTDTQQIARQVDWLIRPDEVRWTMLRSPDPNVGYDIRYGDWRRFASNVYELRRTGSDAYKAALSDVKELKPEYRKELIGLAPASIQNAVARMLDSGTSTDPRRDFRAFVDYLSRADTEQGQTIVLAAIEQGATPESMEMLGRQVTQRQNRI